jgi:guanylate kinase
LTLKPWSRRFESKFRMSNNKVRMIIIAAPSGAGKSSFVERISVEIPRICDTITYTTRPMRAGESEAHPYHFVTRERFLELREQGFFVEWALVHENLYGTPMHQLEDAWAEDRVIIMDVDVQGAETFKRKFPDAVTIFILPPSIEELRRRVIKRDGKVPKDLDIRMANAEREVNRAHEFDIRLVNDQFDKSYQEFKKIIEELLARR